MKQREASDDDRIDRFRATMVDALRNDGTLTRPEVEAAFRRVPRHVFLPDIPPEDAYRDVAIATKRVNGVPVSSSSQPAIMAIMLQQLDLHPGHRVLEIGAGTGYNAALMAHIVGEHGGVTTVDIDEDVAAGAERHLRHANVERVRVIHADGSQGYPDGAPYDRIILTVGAPDVLPAWWEQLTFPGGRLVLPLSLGGPQESIALEHVDDHLTSRSIYDCGFMRLRGPSAGREVVFPLGPDPGLFLTLQESSDLDPEQIHALLRRPYRDERVGIAARPQEAWGSLRLWLGLHDSRVCALTAEASMTEHDIVPPFLQSPSPDTRNTSYGLVSRQSVNLLTYGTMSSSSYKLFIRSFGNDDGLGNRLREHVAAWDAAGRPTSDRLHVDVYRKGAAPQAGATEMLLSNPWTDIVLRWA
ncbi:MAG: hypothetical protein NVSMB22_09390 [Chloroflexota bacterium]